MGMLAVEAQLETSKWYFGSAGAVDFASGVPVNVTTSAMYTGEGSASIADAAGNLLFYTSGNNIWNRNNVVMANGSGMNGSSISAQSAVIVKQPASSTNYYVFTMRNWTDGGNGAHYSVVDMSLNGGLGDVTATKNVLLYGNTRESLTAVCHTNNTDYWIVLHDMYTNEFHSYLLTSAGLNPVPVISAVGSVFTGGNRYGCLKASPDGSKLVYAIGGSVTLETTQLYDFDRTTGMVSNPVTLNTAGSLSDAYGTDFSSDGSVLYVCAFNGTSIQQYNVLAGSPAAILASRQVIVTGGNVKANLQLAVDNKIYVCLAYQNGLGVINSPNTLGTGCNYVNAGVALGSATCGLGLPNFMPCLIPIILPVEWGHFEAALEGTGVGLDWVVSCPGKVLDVRDFVVERKVGTGSFEVLEDVEVSAAGDGWRAYDGSPVAGENQYRIGVVDADGEVTYGGVRTVVFEGGFAVRMWPNPVGSDGLLHLGLGDYEGQATVRVMDMGGRVVWEGPQADVLRLDVGAGVYVVELRLGDGRVWRARVVRQ